jgi:hypothetical protein
MRHQIWPVALLIALMCLVRAGLAAYGYVQPLALMESLGAPASSNPQMPYIVRVWAVRDVVLAVLVLLSTRQNVKGLLLACIAIDGTDVVSAHLSSGLFSAENVGSLKLTAVAALVPESLALGWMVYRDAQQGKV